MKKLFYLLLVLPLGFLFSCSDDNDFPEVKVTTAFEGASYFDNTIYMVQGDTLFVENISATPLGSSKSATVANLAMFWDWSRVYPNYYALIGIPQPVPGIIATVPGNHLLQLNYNILQVDKSISTFQSDYKVTVVESEDQLPAGCPEPGSFSVSYDVQPKN